MINETEIKQRFETDGFVRVSGLLGQHEVEALRNAVDHQMDELSNTPTSYDFQALSDYAFSGSDDALARDEERLNVELYKAVINNDEEARPLDDVAPGKAKGRFGFNAGGWHQDARIARVALTSEMSSFASMLLGDQPLRLWEDTTFVKEPGATVRSAFHQDKHFACFEGDQDIVAWVALDRADEDSGALEYIKGSHRWNETFAPNMFFAQTTLPGAPSSKLPDIEANKDDYEIVRVDAEPGDIVFHHGLTVHGAGGNRSSRIRRAISFRYVGPDCRYCLRPGSLPQSWVQHSLQHGDPLDCTDYPVARSRSIDVLREAA
ncbi:MAG: phytanoyl-CoA dioxygenase family protein [Pseudomonadota bacterium]